MIADLSVVDLFSRGIAASAECPEVAISSIKVNTCTCNL